MGGTVSLRAGGEVEIEVGGVLGPRGDVLVRADQEEFLARIGRRRTTDSGIPFRRA